MRETLLEGLYVAVPAFGGARGAARAVSTNKGCARRPQRLPGWGEWGPQRLPGWEDWEQEVVEVVGAGGVDIRECMWE